MTQAGRCALVRCVASLAAVPTVTFTLQHTVLAAADVILAQPVADPFVGRLVIDVSWVLTDTQTPCKLWLSIA